MPESPIIIGDLLSYDTSLEWHEAVALVQEVCAQLRSSHTVAPDPTHIQLDQSGAVTLLAGPASGEPAVQRLGYTLSALLEGAAPPAELRLFAAQMTSSTEGASSVDDFSHRLAYFERPGRSRILQRLFERVAPLLEVASARSTVVRAPEPSAATKKTITRVPPAWTKVAVIVLSVSAVGVLAVLGWQRVRAGAPVSVRMSGIVSQTKATAGSLVAGTVSSARALLDRVGLVEATPAPAAPDESHEKTARTRAPSGTRKPADRSDGDSQPPAALSPVLPAGKAESAAPQTSHRPETSEAPPTELTPADVTVYTSSDSAVQPPVLVSPQLPGRFPEDGADGPPMPPMEVDLLINQDGSVETVKFLNPPQRFQQRMLASAMKAWHYRPAMKDGRPVRFRLRVKLPL